jgi:hypothetical protein
LGAASAIYYYIAGLENLLHVCVSFLPSFWAESRAGDFGCKV